MRKPLYKALVIESTGQTKLCCTLPGKAVSVFEALSESSKEEGTGDGLEEGSGRSSLTPML